MKEKNEKRYTDYTSFLRRKFGQRVQKISIDAGFTCPNRDGSVATGGCSYCNNNTFNPFYCTPEKPVSQQLAEGIAFFAKKYKAQKYLAYFQAYSNTYADLAHLKNLYEQALAHPAVIGLVLATRPDCVDEPLMQYLATLAKKHYIVIEYGIESTYNATLAHVNRGHNFEQAVEALKLTASFGLPAGVHLIAGLPGESREMILDHARKISELPVQTLKLHQLQIIRNTPIAHEFAQEPERFLRFSPEGYVELMVDFLEGLNPAIVVERFISESPPGMVLSPKWEGLKNFEIVAKIEKRLRERNTRQGEKWKTEV